MTAEELFQLYLDQTPQQRYEAACRAGQLLKQWLDNESGMEEDDKGAFLFYSIGMFIAADGVLTRGELDMFNAIYDGKFSPEDLGKYFAGCAEKDFVEKMDQFIDSMPQEPKLALCSVGLCILTSDGELNEYEIALFHKILAQ